MNYTEKLQNIIKQNISNLIIGLDPDIQKLPSFLLEYKNPVLEFNKLIVQATKDIAAGYKLNAAFYECMEEQGLEALKHTVALIPDEMIKICDAKRGDMENSSEYYARAYFDNYNFDSITLSPYMGSDSVAPFTKRKGKFAYILALTSNPGGKDFQFLKSNGKHLYEIIIDKALGWSGNNNIGFVFGANHATELKAFTSMHSEIPLLIPGIGAQKNDLQNLVLSIHSKNFLINSSRSIIYSAPKGCNEKEFIDSVIESAMKLNSEINASLI